MGYTHYWKQTRALTATEMGEIASAFDKIRTASKIPLAGWDGSGEPDSGPDAIRFNGVGEEAHETFFVGPKLDRLYESAPLGFAFCKTAAKPYDIVVTAMLTVLAAEYGFEASSDGNFGDWDGGVRLACKAMGKIYRNPMKKEEAA